MSTRVRPWLRRVAMVAVVVLVPVVAYSAWDYIELRRLIREIEAIRGRGEPVDDRLAARDYSRLSADQQRAGDYYAAAATLAQHTNAAAPMQAMHVWLATNAGSGSRHQCGRTFQCCCHRTCSFARNYGCREQ